MKKPLYYPNTEIHRDEELKVGELLEEKVRRIETEDEPIEDGAPLIYTPKEGGVIAAYNIRTDKWEIAQDAMAAKYRAEIAKVKNPNEAAAKSGETNSTNETTVESTGTE